MFFRKKIDGANGGGTSEGDCIVQIKIKKFVERTARKWQLLINTHKYVYISL